jgi:hypothetical protein
MQLGGGSSWRKRFHSASTSHKGSIWHTTVGELHLNLAGYSHVRNLGVFAYSKDVGDVVLLNFYDNLMPKHRDAWRK